jgi:hypothetical protein
LSNPWKSSLPLSLMNSLIIFPHLVGWPLVLFTQFCRTGS